MTSISSALGAQSFSPLSRLQNELASELSSGAISSSDKDALSAALSDIASSLQSQGAGGGQTPSPGHIKSKIDDLIAGEVSSGKLTSAQADELKNVFAKAFQDGPGAVGGLPGTPGGVPGAEGDKSSTSSTDSDQSKLLTDFFKLIQDSQGSSSSYSTNGSSLASQIQALIVNYQA